MRDWEHRRSCWSVVIAGAFGLTMALGPTAARTELIELAYYRMGEDDGVVHPGDPLSASVDRIERRDMRSFGSMAYSDDTPVSIVSSRSVEFDGEMSNYLFSEAVPWHTLFPGLRVGMEAFIKIDEAIAGHQTVPFGNGTGYSLSVDSDGRFHAHGNQQTPPGPTPVQYGEWQHVAFWTTGGNWQIYIDGDPQFDFDMLPVFGYASPSGSATIGADLNGNAPMVGWIDEMRIFTWTGPFNPADLLFFSLRQPGDVNEDGAVDQADYDIWRANVGDVPANMNLIEGRAIGDLNGDREIDLSDFGLIKEHRTPGAMIIVPEPAEVVSVIGVVAILFDGSRRARSRKRRQIPEWNRIASVSLGNSME